MRLFLGLVFRVRVSILGFGFRVMVRMKVEFGVRL